MREYELDFGKTISVAKKVEGTIPCYIAVRCFADKYWATAQPNSLKRDETFSIVDGLIQGYSSTYRFTNATEFPGAELLYKTYSSLKGIVYLYLFTNSEISPLLGSKVSFDYGSAMSGGTGFSVFFRGFVAGISNCNPLGADLATAQNNFAKFLIVYCPQMSISFSNGTGVGYTVSARPWNRGVQLRQEANTFFGVSETQISTIECKIQHPKVLTSQPRFDVRFTYEYSEKEQVDIHHSNIQNPNLAVAQHIITYLQYKMGGVPYSGGTSNRLIFGSPELLESYLQEAVSELPYDISVDVEHGSVSVGNLHVTIPEGGF